jgi:D-arabinose 1-dehydrogenase-like Zn-dependent alcohol dehydrogenase
LGKALGSVGRSREAGFAGFTRAAYLSVVGSFVGSNVDLAEMLSLASKTGVRPWIEKVGNTCEDVNNGIKKLMSGKARYRVVICGQGRQ